MAPRHADSKALGPFIAAAHAVLPQGLVQALEPIFLKQTG